MVQDRLLDTAVDRFGRFGFEGASTRDIARASGTAMSSITYHFGGKHGLYLAAADHIAAGIAELHAPMLAEIATARDGTREQARDALLLILDHFAQTMLRPESELWARFIIREQQEPTEAFDRLFRGAMAPVVGKLVDLLARVRDDLSPREVSATAILLVGQAMILRAGRAAVCRMLGVEAIDEDSAVLLRARLRDNLLCILSEKR
jgi:AcrR family transcriptional regulator